MSVRAENRFKERSIERFRAAGHLAGQLEAAGRPRRQPAQRPERPAAATRRQVRNWLRLNAPDYDGATALAEAANAAFPLPAGAMDDPDHWIWDEAFHALEES